MAFFSLTNARGLHIENAEQADRLGNLTHVFRYRGATIESLRGGYVVTSGDDLSLRPYVTICATLPCDVVARHLQAERTLTTHAEAAGYAMGAVDQLLAEHSPAPEVVDEATRYRQVQRRFHQLGRQMYGDAWDETRRAYVRAYTEGRESSSKALEASELLFFIGRWETELARRAGDGDSRPARLAA